MIKSRFEVLDGWRGISIVLVLLGHLFPMGPKIWQMNASVASCGMVIFFILSGFLITNLLIRDQNIVNFLTRRFLRILPLAWLVMIITLTLNHEPLQVYFAHFLFFANIPPTYLTNYTGHLWSLCVEMQFYVLIAVLVALFKRQALWLLPIFLLAITSIKFIYNIELTIATYHRVDEILAGSVLALINYYKFTKLKCFISKLPILPLLVLTFITTHPNSGMINYLRPYSAMLLVGSTLFSTKQKWYTIIFSNKILFYLASVSYALYVFHGVLGNTWLGSGETTEKYIKRLPLLIITFIMAHISTFYYESYWIKLGKNITKNKKIS